MQVIVDYSAEWCGPCKIIGPYFSELADKNPSLLFVNVDVDDMDSIASENGITAMPTFQVQGFTPHSWADHSAVGSKCDRRFFSAANA